MIDRARIYVKAGDGGDGCNSFKGKKFTRGRRPDGGSGGRGTDLVIRVDNNTQSLEPFQFRQHFRAENGKHGQANKKKGADGRPCIIKVPPGTIVRDINNELLLRDLIGPDEELVVAKGGGGGKANTRTKLATFGLPGEEKYISLELKLITDVGIIGYPNVGKSSLLTKLSSAQPKIANYPFTTLVPFLAVVESSDFTEPSHLTIIEIPALIKGACQGKGLGAQFLRHAERTKVFIHLIDMAAQEGRDPLDDYRDLNQELKAYNPQLLDKLQILVANKMDLAKAEANLNRFSSKVKKKIYPISTLTNVGIEELLNDLKGYFHGMGK